MSDLAGVTSQPFKIGDIGVANPVILAPMSGVTDAPFRRLAARLGAGLVVSEMTACASTTCSSSEIEATELNA